MLAAEVLHQLVVVRADALQKITDRLAQLMGTKDGVLPVRAQVLLAEGGHAGEAGLRRLSLHAGITADHALLFLLSKQAGRSAATDPDVEGLHHGGEDRVSLQLRLAEEYGATLRAAVGVLPEGEQAFLAEVVPAGSADRTVEGTETDAAGQLLFQTEQRGRLLHCGHDRTKGSKLSQK